MLIEKTGHRHGYSQNPTLIYGLTGDDLPAIPDTDIFFVDDLQKGAADSHPERDINDFKTAMFDGIPLKLLFGNIILAQELLTQITQLIKGFQIDGAKLP